MSIRGRRWANIAILVVGALAIAGASVFARLAGDTERITNYWTSADLDDTGAASVTELIEYDFGGSQRRGIFRDIEELDTGEPVSVRSRTAPDQFTVAPGSAGDRIRIGNPEVTIDGRHLYEIQYSLLSLESGGVVAWDAIGTRWNVGTSNAEVHLRAPFDLLDPICSKGRGGSRGGCTANTVAPGHLVVDVGSLSGPSDDTPGSEGVTIEARVGAPVPLPAAPDRPDVTGSDPGTDLLPVGLAALLGALAPMMFVSEGIRRLGREQVWAGGAADAAYGPGNAAAGEPRAVVRLDAGELSELATIEFVPPDGLEPWQGGVVDREQVRSEHQAAWLVQRAVDGEITLTGDEKPVVGVGPEGVTDPILLQMFNGRSAVELGKRDASFRKAWTALEKQQQRYAKTSPLWQRRGDRTRTWALVLGGVALVLGLIATVVGGVFCGRYGAAWLPLVAGGAVVAGAGLAAVVRSWELRVRTPIGSAEWLKIESFRQFLAGSEAHHADWAAEHGILREYTAWAVALDEIDRWSQAVAQSAVARTDTTGYYLAATSSRLGAATVASSASRSSSGGGGGGVGGGGGGGGGGSW